MESRMIEVNGVGLVLFERSLRARRLNIRIRPHKGIRVAIPIGFSFEGARDYVDSKVDWIRKHLDRFEAERKRYKTVATDLTLVDRKEAKQRLIRRLTELSGMYGFSYNRVFIRNQKTRWGSCSARNNISLNIKLAFLPEILADYVILHELVHTRIKNHGKNFWKTLDRLIKNAKCVDRRLNDYRMELL